MCFSLVQFAIFRFPTIYLVPKGQNSRPIKFDGSRTVDDLIEFIQRNTIDAIKFIEPEEKYLKKSEDTEKGQDTAESGESSGTCSGDDNSGQCSADKTEL